LLNCLGAFIIQWTKKGVELLIKPIKIKEIFMFWHLKPWNGNLLLIHSNECKGIQTKSLFDEILCLNFDLRHLKMNKYCAKRSQFCKGLDQKDSHNKLAFWCEKKLKDKNLLTTFKYHSYF
jgi:hypothetical protein